MSIRTPDRHPLRFWQYDLCEACSSSLCFRALGAVLRPALLAISNADGIQRAAHHVVTHARQIFHATASDQYNRVLLQVVADPGNVGGDLDPVGQAHASNLAQRRVRLLWRLRINAGANTAFLRTLLQGRDGRFVSWGATSLANQLIKGRHNPLVSHSHPGLCICAIRANALAAQTVWSRHRPPKLLLLRL